MCLMLYGVGVFRKLAKKIAIAMGYDCRGIQENVARMSLYMAIRHGNYSEMVHRLRVLAPDISNQETHEVTTGFWELKRRALQAFQCTLMMEALNYAGKKKITVCDIGDSAGTHMYYLKELTKGHYDIDTISVNLDPRAIERLKARGYKAILCRAEELDLHDVSVDLFTSFEMVEHLHNPALFFRRLATKSSCTNMVITIPFLKESRVGLHHVRARSTEPIEAEQEHIFELKPEDWKLLLLHSGWEVVSSKCYYQYPQWFFVSSLLRKFWKKTDYEGFWGAILKRNTAISNAYLNWEI